MMRYHFDRDTLVTIGFHLLVLMGVWFAGWDPFSLVVLYWLETLVIGFWTIVLVALTPRQRLRVFSSAAQPSYTGTGMALFVLAHAGLFMAVHLFFLEGVFGADLMSGTRSGSPSIVEMLLSGKLWLPLAGLFAIRAVMTITALRRGESVDRPLIGFYFRIVVMQLAIISGGFLVVFLGATSALLMLVLVRIGFELAVPSVEDYVETHLDKLQDESASKKKGSG